VPEIPSFEALASLKGDPPHPIPEDLPTYTKKSSQYRHAETSVYPYLETNIDSNVMEFSQEPIAGTKSPLSIQRHGEDTPFRHHSTVQKYVEGLLERNGYQDLVEYNTTVERVESRKQGRGN
jgi:cation diffusion facilitator CzcD-associated flavoprotein CzcO